MAIPLPRPARSLERPPLPEVETDGECLILRRVLIGSQPHDIRVWRYTDQQQPISPEGAVLIETVRKTERIAQAIFQSQELIGKKLCYREGECHEEGSDEALSRHVFDSMKELHYSYFKEDRTTWSKEGTEPLVVVPKKIPITSVKPTKIEFPRDEDDEKSSVPIATSSLDSLLGCTTVQQLIDYSKAPETGHPLYKLYQLYLRVVQDPGHEGAEEKALKNWLYAFYLTSLQEAKKREDLWPQIQPSFPSMNFEQWSKYSAAAVFLKDIALPDGVSFDGLMQYLISQ